MPLPCVVKNPFPKVRRCERRRIRQQPGQRLGPPGKTQLKKQSHDLQELGEALVAMPDDRLMGLGMEEILLDATASSSAPSPSKASAGRCNTSAS